MGHRRRFTPEFKRQAVELLNAGQRLLPRLPGSSAFRAIASINGRKPWPCMVARFPAQGDKPNPPVNWRASRMNWRGSPRSETF